MQVATDLENGGLNQFIIWFNPSFENGGLNQSLENGGVTSEFIAIGPMGPFLTLELDLGVGPFSMGGVHPHRQNRNWTHL